MIPLVLNFGTGVWTGWGILGMNLMGQFANDEDFEVIAPMAGGASMFTGMTPLHYTLMEKIRSRPMPEHDNYIQIDCIGNDLRGSGTSAKCPIGRVIIEKPDPKGVENLGVYPYLLTGSRWCAELIESISGREAKVIHEGIDPSIFHPSPRSGWLGDTFNIYSAGKVEHRKGQDLVLRAFRAFVSRHQDARLVTLWNSPFADLGNGYRGTLEEPLWMGENGFLNVKRWAHDNGIDADKVLELGCVPNWMLPQVLKEMDVAVFPSRIESCTCLPLMEAMACGILVIAPNHSGLKDVLRRGLDLVLERYQPIKSTTEYFFPHSDIDWYECDVDEIVEKLEVAYGRRGSVVYPSSYQPLRTWADHAAELKAWLLEGAQYMVHSAAA